MINFIKLIHPNRPFGLAPMLSIRWLFCLAVIFFPIHLYSQTGIGNSAYENGLDFFGNPAAFTDKQGPSSLIEISRPWLSNQYFAGVSTWHNLGLGYQYYNQNQGALRSHRTSLQYSEAVLDWFHLGFRANLHQGNINDGDQFNWDWGMRLTPWGWFSLGLHHNSFNQWKGSLPGSTHYGAWLQIPGGFIQGGLSWSENGIQLPFWGSKISRKFDLDSADFQIITSLAGLQLAVNVPLESTKDQDLWQYSLQLKNNFNSLGITTRPENGAGTLAWTSYELKTMKSKFNFGQKVLTLGGKISDDAGAFSLFDSDSRTTLHSVLQTLQAISANPIQQELILKLEALSLNWANAREIRQALIELQSQGTYVKAYLENPDTKSYYIASAANQVIIHPSAYLKILGFSAEINFYKGLFDTLNVQAQFIRHGKYKSAIEPYVLDSISPEARNDYQRLQNSLWNSISQDIQISRKVGKDQFNSFVDSAFMSNDAAMAAGLIDSVAYFDEIYDDRLSDQIYPREYNLQQPSLGPVRYIAVIQLEGSIISGESGRNSFSGGKYIGHKTVERQLLNAASNPNIAGVILRVNSPGGSAWASDEIHRAVEIFKDSKKPIIASVGGVAASGGYYIIAGVDRIFTEQTSILGSIGIFGGKFVTSGLFQRFGVNTSVVKTHESADAESMQRLWTPKEVQRIQDHMDEFYRGFVEIVSTGRGLDTTLVDSLGQGRIYTGVQALDHGLADQEGGIFPAIRYMMNELNTPLVSENFRIMNISPYESGWMSEAAPFIFWKEALSDHKKPIIDMIKTLNEQTLWVYDPYLEQY